MEILATAATQRVELYKVQWMIQICRVVNTAVNHTCYAYICHDMLCYDMIRVTVSSISLTLRSAKSSIVITETALLPFTVYSLFPELI